jgi:diguanylate cyclase (GGDEF)-like protein/PAS domain S-box-containing protein
MSTPCEISDLEDPIETRILQQAELLDAIVSSMAQGLLAVDAKGFVVATNQQFRLMHNLPEDLCKGGNHFLDLARYAAAHGHYGPGDPELLAQNRWRDASACDNHYRALSVSPSGLSIEVTGRSMPGGGFVNTYTDATQSLAREAALRETEARFRLLAEHSSDVICLIDSNGFRQYVSPSVERVLGWKPEELCGRNGLDFVHPEDLHIFRDAQSSIANGDSESSALFRHRRPDNSWLWIEGRARVPLVSEARETSGYIVVLRDATDRVHTEQLLRYALDQIQLSASIDGLTGLANRGRFDEFVEQEWRRCSRSKLPLSVLMIDADHFKLFNDCYGHMAGDECLRAIASQITTVTRRPGDLAARYGGEEFVLVMPETNQEGALHVARRLCSLVQSLGIPHSGNPLTGVVTVSIGVASCSPNHMDNTCLDLKALLSAADVALYGAKREGRNRIGIAGSS